MMERLERKEREFNRRRAEILDKAEKIFSLKGFHNVKMADIANASGFSVGSLYQFFKGKENLYATMITEKLDLMYSRVRNATDSAGSVIEKIDALIYSTLMFAQENPEFCRLFVRGESAALSEAMTRLRQQLIDGYFEHITFIENLLKEGIEIGLLKKLPSRDMAQALFNLIRTSLIEWMLDSTKESPCSKKDFIMEIFLNGARNHEK
ncbi:MAG: TetR/AcrR family transcriptional regulator [Smithella sp.]|nr:TetR/AcrR family transcriptional regulator [Smithella sp.]